MAYRTDAPDVFIQFGDSLQQSTFIRVARNCFAYTYFIFHFRVLIVPMARANYVTFNFHFDNFTTNVLNLKL